MSKVKSFKGRRLVLDMEIPEVAQQVEIPEKTIEAIEKMEKAIQALNEFYENRDEVK